MAHSQPEKAYYSLVSDIFIALCLRTIVSEQQNQKIGGTEPELFSSNVKLSSDI